MNGTITNYRMGVNTQKNNHLLIKLDDEKYNNKIAVAPLLGKKVVFTTIGKKVINGKVASAHGNKGIIRVIFEKGLPGDAIGQKVEIK
jgi:large subunit ribosomal protein L35Ae